MDEYLRALVQRYEENMARGASHAHGTNEAGRAANRQRAHNDAIMAQAVSTLLLSGETWDPREAAPKTEEPSVRHE